MSLPCRLSHVLSVSLVAAAGAVALWLPSIAGAAPGAPVTAPASTQSSCRLGPTGAIRHVVEIQFDNVHLRRDAANVPSEIEQIPALYNFMRDNGSLLSNDHTVLISHTADGVLSTETGLYPSGFGGGVANSYPYLDPHQTHTDNGSSIVPGTSSTSLFNYWTGRTGTNDPLYTLIHGAAGAGHPQGVNTPAPWVAYTHAGCDVGAIGTANMELENSTGNVKNVFGQSSAQAALSNWSYNTAYGQHNAVGSALGGTDFEGLAIHCSRGDSIGNGICSAANGGTPDRLPDEPGGYRGYRAQFGALGVNPILTGKPDGALPTSATPKGDTAPPAGNWQAPPVYDVFSPNADNTGSHPAPDPGNADAQTTPPPSTYAPGQTPTSEVLDGAGNPGFPGFDGMEANNALGYTAAAQEAGVPVTYTYISDVHDDEYNLYHGNAFGPGEAGQEAQLREYNAAFTAFFHRLAADGITKHNTLFTITVDEGDHYAGGAPSNPGCDGVTVTCHYDTAEAGGAAYGSAGYRRDAGQIDVNLPALIRGTTGDQTKLAFDDDDAPAFIVPNQSSPSGPRPGPDSTTVRSLEREMSMAKESDPIAGSRVPISQQMADETEESILHMVNADPNRTPTFTMFGNPDFYFQSVCTDVGAAQGQQPAPVSNGGPGCPAQDYANVWNHGDIQHEIANTWQGWVGPGIAHRGETAAIWTDHTDVRPTMMTLLGLHDDYAWEGRAIEQIIAHGGAGAIPERGLLDRLGAVYKQLEAPYGSFGLDTLGADTTALASTSPGDATYLGTDRQLQACDAARSALAPRIQAALTAAETGRQALSPSQADPMIAQARRLIGDARSLAQGAVPPTGNVCG